MIIEKNISYFSMGIML